jgi:protein-S-isoprenylcysteine O-methyltransferase Ste14
LPVSFWLASLALGLWTLSANRPGNFNIQPEPKAHGHLVTSGPYRWVRHPMYGSVLLLAAGASAWLMSLTGAVLWLVLLAVLIAKARLEEQWLVQRYPTYVQYQQGTWRLVPWIY